MHALVVDLDHTLIKTDILWEQLVRLLKFRPWMLPLVPFWILRGPLYLKSRLSSLVQVEPDRLPYREEVLVEIKKARQANRKVILASASHMQVVSRISHHLGYFDECLGSDSVNLKGRNKLTAISNSLGDQPFDYIGDSQADLEVWSKSELAICVNPTSRIQNEIKALKKETRTIVDRPSLLKTILSAVRAHQWVKNFLIFIPVLTDHRYMEWPIWRDSILAFLGFSLVASAVYLINDLLDLDADRVHHSKKERPLASGNLSIPFGLKLIPLSFALAAAISYFLPLNYGLALAIYLSINLFYSMVGKQALLLDVVILAFLYTIRIYTGAEATGIEISHWLLGFSTFFFFGLAFLKRYVEIRKNTNQGKLPGRSYQKEDELPVLVLGIGASLLSVLVMVFYVDSLQAEKNYYNPRLLWLVVPVFLYWISRVWIFAHRRDVLDDPVVFAARDRATWLVVLFISAIVILARQVN